MSGQFLAYLNHKLNQSTNSLHNIGESESNASTLKNTLSLDNLDDYSDDSGHPHNKYFDQADIMEILSNNNSYPSSVYDDFNHDTQQLSSLLLNTHINSEDSAPPSIVCLAKNIANIDSDEGSISSGCETSSTMTTATNENEKVCSVLDRVRNFEQMAGKGTIERRRHDSASCPASTDNMPKVFVRSVTIPAPGVKPNYALPATHHHKHHLHLHQSSPPSATISNNNLVCNLESIDSDSELSDESGYVEFQENNLIKKKTLVIV